MQPAAVPLTDLLQRLVALLTALLGALGLEMPAEVLAGLQGMGERAQQADPGAIAAEGGAPRVWTDDRAARRAPAARPATAGARKPEAPAPQDQVLEQLPQPAGNPPPTPMSADRQGDCSPVIARPARCDRRRRPPDEMPFGNRPAGLHWCAHNVTK
jgi:hypothetical protein